MENYILQTVPVSLGKDKVASRLPVCYRDMATTNWTTGQALAVPIQFGVVTRISSCTGCTSETEFVLAA